MILLLVCSMEGGELFDRIQKKGHFTERGMLKPGGRRGKGRGGDGRNDTELSCTISLLCHMVTKWEPMEK